MSSSYNLGGYRNLNRACYADLINSYSEGDYIIIDPSQRFYSDKQTEMYLNDLMDMGFEFRYQKFENGEIHIYPEFDMYRMKGRAKMLGMAIRYLWEGRELKYDTEELIYLIFIEYMKLRKRDLNFTKLELLILAHNVTLIKEYRRNRNCIYRFNSNHMWCIASYGCKNIELIPKNTVGVNGYYSREERWVVKKANEGWKYFTNKRLKELL